MLFEKTITLYLLIKATVRPVCLFSIFAWSRLTLVLEYSRRSRIAGCVRPSRLTREHADVSGTRKQDTTVWHHVSREDLPGTHHQLGVGRTSRSPSTSGSDGFPPHVDSRYEGRIRIVKQASIEIKNIQIEDEGWYECSVVFLGGNDKRNENGTWVYLSVNGKIINYSIYY